jgi:hypothetical protein
VDLLSGVGLFLGCFFSKPRWTSGGFLFCINQRLEVRPLISAEQKSKEEKAMQKSEAQKGFSAEEARALRAHQLSIKKPFRGFQVGVRAWVLSAEFGDQEWLLRLEVYHPNMSGTNRHLISVCGLEYQKFFENHGYCPESPAPKIGPM